MTPTVTSCGFSTLHSAAITAYDIYESRMLFVRPPFTASPMNEIERGTWPLHLGNVLHRRVESPLPPPRMPEPSSLFPILFSSLFYSLSVELHFIIVYTWKLNEDSRRCEKFKFYVSSFCLYAGTLLGCRYSRLQWRRLEHLWMNCLLRSSLRAEKKKSLTIWSARLTTRIIRTLGDHWVQRDPDGALGSLCPI